MIHHQTHQPMLGGGLCPRLEDGVRPDIVTPINTVGVLRDGKTVVMSPSPIRRASWASSAYALARAQRMVGVPDIVERVSREDVLCADIEDALRTGGTIDGFLSLSMTLSGAVKAIPHKGKVIVAKDARMLARIVDRELQTLDIVRLLGLAGPVAGPGPGKTPGKSPGKKSQWQTLPGGLASLGVVKS